MKFFILTWESSFSYKWTSTHSFRIFSICLYHEHFISTVAVWISVDFWMDICIKKRKKKKKRNLQLFFWFLFCILCKPHWTTHIVTSTPITCYLLILRSPLGAFHCGTFSGAYAIARLSWHQYGCRLRGSAIGRWVNRKWIYCLLWLLW